MAGRITPFVGGPGGEEDQEDLPIEESPGPASGVGAELEALINGLEGGGRPLPGSARSFHEARFAHDFSRVRIHDDGREAALARSMNARAFTVGRDIVFAPGAYSPETVEGRRLLAHELTHTIQQTGGGFAGAPSHTAPALQGQFEKPPQPLPPPEFECKIDLIMAARVLAGDKTAALKVLDCCVSGLPVVGRGCTSSLVDAACKLLPKLCEEKKKEKEKKKTKCPLGSKPVGDKCCPEGTENVPHRCCAPSQMIRKPGGFAECCRPPMVPNDDETRCILPPLKPCPPDRAVPLFEKGVFVPRFACVCAPESRQNLKEGVCCPVGQDGSSGACVPEGKKPGPPPPGPPFTVVETFNIGFEKDAPQVWFDPRASFQVSVTPEGKDAFKALVARLDSHPEEHVELQARASSDKPANDPDYNRRLTDRRVRLIADELQKKKIDIATRVTDPPGQTPPPGCEPITGGQLSCGDNGAKTPPDKEDRKVTATVFSTTKSASP